MHRFLYFSVVVLLLNSACESSKPTSDLGDDTLSPQRCIPDSDISGIVNGRLVHAGDTDATKAVLLVILGKNDSTSSCTGTLISDKVILTAAHCLEGARKTDIRVVFHPDLRCSSGFDVQTKSISSVDYIIHEKYGTNSKHVDFDLALLKLAAPAPMHYQTQSLYDGQSPLSSDNLLVVGYGVTEGDAKDSSRMRKTVKSFKNETQLVDHFLYLNQSTHTGGACAGDSGGPVYVESDGIYKIIGVNSAVHGKDMKSACRNYSIVTYMPLFADWVKENLKKLE